MEVQAKCRNPPKTVKGVLFQGQAAAFALVVIEERWSLSAPLFSRITRSGVIVIGFVPSAASPMGEGLFGIVFFWRRAFIPYQAVCAILI
jgi:hypothetical protein